MDELKPGQTFNFFLFHDARHGYHQNRMVRISGFLNEDGLGYLNGLRFFYNDRGQLFYKDLGRCTGAAGMDCDIKGSQGEYVNQLKCYTPIGLSPCMIEVILSISCVFALELTTTTRFKPIIRGAVSLPSIK